MKKIILTCCLIICLLSSTGCKSSNKLETDKIHKQFAYDIDELKKLKYDNLDLKNVAIKLPDNLNEIYKLKLDPDDELSKMTNKDYIEDFKKQVAFLSPTEKFDDKYVTFQAEGSFQSDEDYPTLNKYKDQILGDKINVRMLDYRSPNVYLCNFKHNVTIPQRMNKGEGTRKVVPESKYKEAPDFYMGTWSFDSYADKVIKKYANNGTHNEEKYNLSGEEVSIGDAINYFETKYYSTLPFQYHEVLKLVVSQIGVVKFDDGSYGYNLYATLSYNGMSFDRSGFGTIEGNDGYETFVMQAFMIKKDDIDFIYGMPDDMTIKKVDAPITSIVSIKDAIKLASTNLTKNVEFQVQNIDFIYQMKSEGEPNNNEQLTLNAEPAWKLTCYNSNDQKFYMVYIDAVSGVVRYYSQW